MRGASNNVFVPRPSTEAAKWAFSYRGDVMWNGLENVLKDISIDQIRVRDLDDENCYVNLEEALMDELYKCAQDVPGTDWKGINVQAEVWYSPAPPKKRKKELETDIPLPPATSEGEHQLDTTYIGGQSYRYTSPVENIIRSKEEQIRKQEAEIARKTHEIASLEQPFHRDPLIPQEQPVQSVIFGLVIHAQIA